MSIRGVLETACLLFWVAFALLGGSGCAPANANATNPSDPAGVRVQHPMAEASALLVEGKGPDANMSFRCSAVAVGDHVALTAAHCVRDRFDLQVTSAAGAHRVTLAEMNTERDIARVHLDGPALPFQAVLRRGEVPPLGQYVYAVGFGCDPSRPGVRPGLFIWERDRDSMQLAMSVCFGDSGGGVYDRDGRLFGIVARKGEHTWATDARGF